MAYSTPHFERLPGDRASEDYWREVETLGVHELVRMADGPDYVGKTMDGRYVRVPDPSRRHDEQLRIGLILLSAHCGKWYN